MQPSHSLSFQEPDIHLKVRAAQIYQLYAQSWVGLIGIIIAAVLVCLALWQTLPQWKLILWLAVLISLTLVRGALVAAFYHLAEANYSLHRWARWHMLGAIASALTWAASFYFLWPKQIPLCQILWPICTVGIASVAMACYCIWIPSCFALIFLTICPLSFRMLMEGGMYSTLGLLGLAFMGILTLVGKILYGNNVKALKQGIQHKTLSQAMALEKKAQEKLNHQLVHDMALQHQSQRNLLQRNRELKALNRALHHKNQGLETYNQQLCQNLTKMQQFRDMLPICSCCKKIRKEDQSWEQVDVYLKKHFNIHFTHGICPDCALAIYPEFMQEQPANN